MSIKVLYFTIVGLADANPGNGGNLCCRNHVIRLKQDLNLELHVVVGGDPSLSSGTARFLTELGVPHVFVPFRAGNTSPQSLTLAETICSWYRGLFHIPLETFALHQAHVDEAVLGAIRSWNIEAIVVDFLFSALFCPTVIRNGDNVVLITLNREAEFYGTLLQQKLVPNGRFTGAVSRWRLASYERWVYRKVRKVVTIGLPDIPRCRLRSEPVCVTPFLDPKPDRWSFSDSRSVFFAGNIAQHPNRLAIEWIATRLAPAVFASRGDVEFPIVGAEEAQVPATWRHQAVKYLGVSDREGLTRLFRSCDLMLCPIENDFGMKFKAAEAIAFGTPMLASRQTLLGIPYLTGVPRLELSDVEQAARLVCSLVGQRNALERISSAQLEQAEAFIATQKTVWSTLVSAGRTAVRNGRSAPSLAADRPPNSL